MIARVITIPTLPESVESARRTIESGRHFGVEVETFRAFTPADDPMRQFALLDWPTAAFTANRYSYPLPCMSAFLSHAALWKLAVDTGESVCVLEHDAVFVAPLPPIPPGTPAVNFAKPSFGRFITPAKPGFGPLNSKPAPHYLPGATGYWITPAAARDFLALAKTCAEPTDVFLNRERFPFLMEYWPWVIECHETITTIQREAGCAAKHRKVRIVQPNKPTEL